MANIMTNAMPALVLVFVLSIVSASIADDGSIGAGSFKKCEGGPRVEFYGENFTKLRHEQGSQKRTKINLSEVEKIKAECGCFYIYSGKNYRSRSEYVPVGEVIDRNQIRFNEVKSIEQVECTQAASPYALVIGAVVGAVIVVAVVLVIATKIYRRRQFQGVSTTGDV